MANPTRSQLKAGAIQIRDETAPNANSATRLGSALLGDVASGLFEYDPNDTYQPGEYCIFQGVLAKAKATIGKGESPQSAPAKWDLRVAKTADDIVLGDYRPVSTNAVAELLTQPGSPAPSVPNATTTTKGKVRLATDAEYETGTASDIVPSVKQVHDQLAVIGQELGEFEQKTIEQLARGSDYLKYDYKLAEDTSVVAFGVLINTPAGPEFRPMAPDQAGGLLLNAMPTRLGIDEVVRRGNGAPLTQNLPIGGDGNVLLIDAGEVLREKGVYVARPDPATGQVNTFDSLLWSPAGVIFKAGNIVRWLVSNAEMVFNHVKTRFTGSVEVQDMRHTAPPVLADFDHIMTAVNLTRGVQEGITSRASLKAWILSLPEFQSLFNQNTGVQYGGVIAIYCQTVYVPPPATTGWQRLTPALLGTAIAHPLETPGNNIAVSMRGIDNRPEDVLTVSYPDNNHVVFTLPDGLTSYPGGSYKLETIHS